MKQILYLILSVWVGVPSVMASRREGEQDRRGHRRNQRINQNRKSQNQKLPYHHTAYGKLITSQNLFKTQKRESISITDYYRLLLKV